MGMGHMRRNMLVVGALSRAVGGQLDALLITGVRDGLVATLPGVDCLSLPSLRKRVDGSYAARNWGLDLHAIIRLRSEAIRASVAAFAPDLLIVDNVPKGAAGELEKTLLDLEHRQDVRCVLGLRDIGDAPGALVDAWRREGHEAAAVRFFDEIWVYGDRGVYDRLEQDGLPAPLCAKARFTGYLDQCQRPQEADDFAHWAASRIPGFDPGQDFSLCVIGGGEDGAHVADTFAESELRPGTAGVVLGGPFLPRNSMERLRDKVGRRADLHLLPVCREPAPLLRNAERVVCMGGYNTLGEVISYDKHSLVVPRVQPRVEQKIRAERFAALGLVDRVLLPAELNSERLSDWLSAPRSQPAKGRERIDLTGLDRIAEFAQALLTGDLGFALEEAVE